MRRVDRSAIVAYSPASLFDLVADVEAYPDFLPGCQDASILESQEGQVLARLDLRQGPLAVSFTTRNTLRRPESIHLDLVDGPFSNLSGEWRFEPLGESGARMSLALEFKFSNRMTDFAMGLVFEQTCNRLVDAFVSRADALCGSNG